MADIDGRLGYLETRVRPRPLRYNAWTKYKQLRWSKKTRSDQLFPSSILQELTHESRRRTRRASLVIVDLTGFRPSAYVRRLLPSIESFRSGRVPGVKPGHLDRYESRSQTTRTPRNSLSSTVRPCRRWPSEFCARMWPDFGAALGRTRCDAIGMM